MLPSWDNVQQVPSAEKHSTGAVHGKRTYYQHVADTQVLGEKRRKTLSLRTSGEVARVKNQQITRIYSLSVPTYNELNAMV